ncbi:uncharacterized protein LOC141627462 [Silene latifolia]|uniref:uncharacterized protein LOC141627462 n=1 Tax=Silene latifolia TaxID=37657 RepID=UPI003D787607
MESMSEDEVAAEDQDMDGEILLQQTHENLKMYVLATLGLIVCIQYYVKYIYKQNIRTSICSGWQFVIEVLNTPGESYRTFRMESHVFIRLAELLVTKYGLHPTREMRAEEALAIFLWICAHNQSNRTLQTRFKHSGETISRKFNEVLTSLVTFSRDIIRPADYNFKEVPRKIRDDYKFWPHFRGCIGAMDGTHVRAVVTPKEDEIPYICIRGYATQNVMAICDFDMLFTFVEAGWEGSAHDSRILTETLAKLKGKNIFPYPPEGKYYLVDAGYSNSKGYLAPFKGKNARYHLADYKRSSQPPTGYFEIFNFAHASLRNVIERSFGVWKNRWRILFNIPSYKFSTQCKIVGLTMALHNFIRKNAVKDEEFDKCDADPNYMPNVEDEDDSNVHGDEDDSDEHGDAADDENMSIVRNSIATSLMNMRRS